jgi:hypothetical protein
VTLIHYPKKKGFWKAIREGAVRRPPFAWAMYRFIHEDLQRTLGLRDSENAVVVE